MNEFKKYSTLIDKKGTEFHITSLENFSGNICKEYGDPLASNIGRAS
jgi:hypothetical protein